MISRAIIIRPDQEVILADSTPVTRALDNLGILYRFFRHPGQVHSLEQAAQERGQQPEQVVRSLVFRLGVENFAMVLVAGPAQVSWPKLRSYFGQSRLTLASEAEVLAATGYRLGSVSPFGLPAPMRILVDRSVLAQQELSIGSGERNTTVILLGDDLLRALGPMVEVGDFT
jgi:Cys-tRNA(Pro)/Cys-tRNA(Cys) deacylase